MRREMGDGRWEMTDEGCGMRDAGCGMRERGMGGWGDGGTDAAWLVDEHVDDGAETDHLVG